MADGVNALELLRSVSNAYRAITTLEIEAFIINESGDDDASSRNEQRVRFYYHAPNRLRYEPCGKDGILQVIDGVSSHTLFRARGFGDRVRVSSVPIGNMNGLPHAFRPDFPITGDPTFLFQGIEEPVADARIVREEGGYHVLGVTYKQPSAHSATITRGDVLFWINPDTLMVMKQQIELGHRFPVDDEVRWNRLTVSVNKMRLNESLSGDVFRFTAPEDASTLPARACGVFSMGGGSGFIQNGPDERRRMEHRSSHEWEGDTLVEKSKWKIRGSVLIFERRLTFLGDEGELNIDERIIGPQSEATGSFKIRLK